MKQALTASILASVSAACLLAAPLAKAQDNQPEPVILMVPVQVTSPQLEAGCWAQFYDKRNFEGEVATLIGPAELDSLDKGTGRQLKRDIDSLVVGPKATLTVYQHQAFKDRSSRFDANAREGGLVKKLGFGGRIQSIKLACTG